MFLGEMLSCVCCTRTRVWCVCSPRLYAAIASSSNRSRLGCQVLVTENMEGMKVGAAC